MVRVNIGIRVTKGKEGKGMVHLGVWEWHKGTGRRGFKPGMSFLILEDQLEDARYWAGMVARTLEIELLEEWKD